MLKTTLLTFTLLVASLIQAQTQDSLEVIKSLNRIYWNDWYRLEWNDFQAEAEEDKSIAALSSIALPYSLSSDGEGTLVVTINVCFVKDESWSIEEEQNNVLLQHEQLHFDIAELHRRKVVKALLKANMTKDNYKETVENIMARVWKKQYREMQNQYDIETNYSQVFKAQIQWNKFIEQELRNYEEYTFTEVNLSLINFED
tara:strand:+ start:21025 stop:21627 length:603 start_codon:yes stop_codon:yes gene_type:complete